MKKIFFLLIFSQLLNFQSLVAKDLWAEGGRAVITANENAADCIKLHADAGSSQTITIVNDAGTGDDAISLTASSGGITLDGNVNFKHFEFKNSCRIATTSNLTVSYSNESSGVGATLTNAGAQAALNIDSTNIKDVIEKPSISKAPSNKAVIGRYILPKKIFSRLINQKPGKGGEIHITDAIQSLIQSNEKFIAHNFTGKYLDCGSMNGYIKSTLEIAKS